MRIKTFSEHLYKYITNLLDKEYYFCIFCVPLFFGRCHLYQVIFDVLKQCITYIHTLHIYVIIYVFLRGNVNSLSALLKIYCTNIQFSSANTISMELAAS